ncbi:uncharacterized protein LOC106143120 [Amyelois transitella]|uniref:uncharacterized protein LOC106143120 n=1 Tax=Amyelois transitella TaxID=680683 RepID=UPI00067DFFBD|nr:uncharacterized protein LOC106143120 [Amyelois transitella]
MDGLSQCDIQKLIALIYCLYYCYASEHSHVIPVEGYETELENLGQHVEIPETPVKVIKITKTIAVKVPVPYPVKVREKVPYPVPISKPYPVPVPQIIKVPHIVHTKSDQPEHDSNNANYGYTGFQGSPHLGDQDKFYQVQETPAHESGHFAPQSFNGYNSGHQNFQDDSSEGSSGSPYGEAASNYYGYTGKDGNESDDTKSYDKAIKDYLEKNQLNKNGASKGFHYH